MSKNSYSKVGGENVRLLQALIDEAPSYTKPTNSRNANILKSIINNTEYNEPPQSEIEELLIALKAKIGGEIEVNELTVTENGSYDAGLNKAYNPVNVELPLDSKEITANGTYNASDDNLAGFSQVTVNVEGYKLKDIPNTPTAIATFSDGSDLPMPKLEVSIEAVQDLHGYDAPWVGGAGKNKLPNIATSQTKNGITLTVNSDGSANVNGTATANTTFVISNITDMNLIVGIRYILNGCPSSSGNFSLTFSDDITTTYSDYGNGVEFTLSNEFVTNNAKVRIFIKANETMSNVLFKPMIRLATVSDTTFAPYENDCPISGWDEVNVGVVGKNLWNNNWSAYTQPSDYRICPIKLENGQYTASVKLKEGGTRQSGFTLGIAKQGDRYTNFGSFYTASTGADKTGTITVDDAWTAPKLIVYCSNESAFNAIFENYEIQLELGTTATTYEAYNGTTYTLDLDGTRYGGKVDLVSGVMTVDRIMFSLNGSENWVTDIVGDNKRRFTCTSLIDLGVTTTTTFDAISNIYVNTKNPLYIDLSEVFILRYLSQYNQNRIDIITEAYQDVASFKAFLNNTNMQICYELATPLTIQLTTIVVKSLRGMNNVWADSGDVLSGKYFAEL